MQPTEQHAVFQRARMSRDQRFDGEFFVAVKTTGIFCRPICPANLPKEENVEYFRMAASAMHAGYRPCLRCRPDSAPSSWAWKGVDTTLERGMGMLRNDLSLPLSDVAEKLGVSDRYFRQLMQKRLGMSPKQYRLYDQVLFAKQLLHQSGLSVEDVAQASGFQSSRRLQENLKRATGLTPRQIRKEKSAKGSGVHIRVPVRQPYCWPQVRDFLARRQLNGVEVVTEGAYERSFKWEEATGHFNARYCEQECAFFINIEIDDIALLRSVVLNIRRVLDVDTPPLVIQKTLEDAGLPAHKLNPGLRLPGVWSLFEAGCRAVLGQQVSVTAAINSVNLLVEHCGETIDGRRYFPTPETIANADLSFLKMPNLRRESLKALAEHVAEHGESSGPEGWLEIKGIGPWTVAYAQMRGRSSPDVWLSSDLVIKKQLAQYDVNAELAAPWRSYLTFQLWEWAS